MRNFPGQVLTPSRGPLLSANRLPAVIDGCTALTGIFSRAKEERHLGHLERIAVANLYSVFEGGWNMAMELFSTLSNFDPKYTAQQMSSLVGKPPLCINEALCGGKEMHGDPEGGGILADQACNVARRKKGSEVVVLEEMQAESARDLLLDLAAAGG